MSEFSFKRLNTSQIQYNDKDDWVSCHPENIYERYYATSYLLRVTIEYFSCIFGIRRWNVK